jgi:catechol 2,3-dioxygenase-like lactoylglutathione lyase family enzyme
MDTRIASLVDQFERGGLNRRQLIKALSFLVATSGASSAAAQTPPPAPSLKGTRIDHVSVLVSDLQRSQAFYQSVFGMKAISEDKPNQILRLGTDRTIVSLRHEGDAKGVVDHFAIAVDGFNRQTVTAQLKQHGLDPQENVQYGFYVRDPDGMVVQVV